MKKVFIVIICILVFSACLVIGFLSDDFPNPLAKPTSISVLPTSAITTGGDTQQQNLILVLIDKLGTPENHLEAVWLLLFSPDYPDLTFLLLYPSAKTPYKNLAAQFKLTPEGKLDSSFIDALRGFKFSYQGFIIIDEEGLSQWVDWLHNIDVDGNIKSGNDVLAYVPKPWENLDNSRVRQIAVASGMCQKTSLLPQDINWFTLFDNLIPDHMSTDLTLENTVEMWNGFMAKSEKAKCKILAP